MTGQRVRILLEWWDPAAQDFTNRRLAELGQQHPGAVTAAYVEPSPPQDEVEGLRATRLE
uniref:hypothetical protein n=1 Tax=Nonomuraea sp. CA-251285 TaxID=3240002 RepID=UPI003F494D65